MFFKVSDKIQEMLYKSGKYENVREITPFVDSGKVNVKENKLEHSPW